MKYLAAFDWKQQKWLADNRLTADRLVLLEDRPYLLGNGVLSGPLTVAKGTLAIDEPPPYSVVNPDGASPYLLLCEHAANRIRVPTKSNKLIHGLGWWCQSGYWGYRCVVWWAGRYRTDA